MNKSSCNFGFSVVYVVMNGSKKLKNGLFLNGGSELMWRGGLGGLELSLWILQVTKFK